MAKKAKKKAKKTTSNKSKGEVAELLSGAQKDWEKAEPRSFGTPLPDGMYEGIIESAVITKSQNDNLMCVWKLLVTDGDCEGRQITKRNMLQTKDNMEWFKGDIETLGLSAPEEFEEIGDILEEACGMAIGFQVRSKDDFTNVDFSGPLEGGVVDDDEPEEAAPDYTKKELKGLKGKKLAKVCEEVGLDPEDYEDDAEMRDDIIKELDL